MKKIIRALICAGSSFIRCILIKIFNWNKFRFLSVQMISPKTEFTIEHGGELNLRGILKTRGDARIIVRKQGVMSIDNNVFLNYGSIVVCRQHIEIGENTEIGPYVVIYDHDHDYTLEHRDGGVHYKGGNIKIGKGVWIGTHSIILKDAEIGDNCVIAAGSVVKGKIPPNTLFVQKRYSEKIKMEN